MKEIRAFALVLVMVGLASGLAGGDPQHGEPQSVAAACGATYADVWWAPVEDPHLEGYDVYERADGESGYSMANQASVTSTEYRVTGLATGVGYEFRVVAVYTDSHESDMSAPASCTTS
jgi:hypothetical protein